MVKLDCRDLHQMFLAECRYALRRDNHLAPSTCVQHIKDYLPDMNKDWRARSAYQLTNEIIAERIYADGNKAGRLAYDSVWEDLLVFLTDFLESLPSNADQYMKFIYNKPTWKAEIDYFSVEMQDKIKANQLQN